MNAILRLSFLWLAVIVAGCSQAEDMQRTDSSNGQKTPDLVFLTRDGCVNTVTMRANLDLALRALGRPADYAVVDLESVASDDARLGYGTPTVLYRNQDLFGMPQPLGNPKAT